MAQTTKAAIKAYFFERLATPVALVYPTSVGPNVFLNRVGPLQSPNLPAIMIYASEETSERLDITQDRRKLKLQLEIQASGETVDEQLDTISDEVVDLFRNDEYLGGPADGLVESCRYSRGQLFFDEKRHIDASCWVIDYDISYLWESVPDETVSNMADFVSMHVTSEFAEQGVTAPAIPPITESVIDLPQ